MRRGVDELDFVIGYFSHHAHVVDDTSAIGFKENQIAFLDFVLVEFAPDFGHVIRRTRQGNIEFLEGTEHQSRTIKTRVWIRAAGVIARAQIGLGGIDELFDHIARIVASRFIVVGVIFVKHRFGQRFLLCFSRFSGGNLLWTARGYLLLGSSVARGWGRFGHRTFGLGSSVNASFLRFRFRCDDVACGAATHLKGAYQE